MRTKHIMALAGVHALLLATGSSASQEAAQAFHAFRFARLPTSAGGPIHRRGRHKPNARRQAGRKTVH